MTARDGNPGRNPGSGSETDAEQNPGRFRFLAAFVAGRSLGIARAPAGEAAYTNGRVVFVSAGGSAIEQRREALLQSALLGAGSLDQRLVRALRARPSVARRYLALEGRRVLADLAGRLPLAAALPSVGVPGTASADESLDVARGRRKVAAPPEWFGVIKPARLLAPTTGPDAGDPGDRLRLDSDLIDTTGSEDEDDEDDGGDRFRESRVLRLFESPLVGSRAVADFLRRMFGGSPSPGDGAAGADLSVRAVRRVRAVGPNARPLPVRIRFTDEAHPGAAVGVGGAFHPEWDVHNNRYRPAWCRVVDFPPPVPADAAAPAVLRDDVLRRRLSRVGVGPKVLRRRADGDELDIEALIELAVDVRSGHTPPEHIHLETRKLTRNLGVLILLDASGSATDTDTRGLAIHDHQRQAAATLAVTLEELGDRVAVYAFRSHGRRSVHLPVVKAFGQPFDAAGRARLHQLRPSGYTRLGAAVRGAGEILKTDAGTPHRLLVLLSDGFPYDDGYEGRYAEADARKALEELHSDGIACLCLSIGTAVDTDTLERVFGSAGHAGAAALADLSPRMDELFLSALRQLDTPGTRKR